MVKMDLKSSMKTSIRACSYLVLLSWLCTEALLATLPSIQYTIPNNPNISLIVLYTLISADLVHPRCQKTM
jgi:hypothetical protein